MLTRALIATVGLAACAAVAAAASPAKSSKPCRPGATTTVASGQKGRVYRRGRHSDLTACLYSSGRKTSLEYDLEVEALGSPSIDVAGEWVAYAAEDNADPTAPAHTLLITANLRTGKQELALAFEPDPLADVGTVKATRNGSAAWIACAPMNGPNTCLHTGGNDRVYTLRRSQRKPTMVGSGADIDPRSLAIHGTVLSWIQSGQRQSVPFR